MEAEVRLRVLCQRLCLPVCVKDIVWISVIRNVYSENCFSTITPLLTCLFVLIFLHLSKHLRGPCFGLFNFAGKAYPRMFDKMKVCFRENK